MKCDVCERDLPQADLLEVGYEGDEQGAGNGWLCEACYDAWCDEEADSASVERAMEEVKA